MVQRDDTIIGFGTVSRERVTYLVRKSWFQGGVEEDIPLRHITSVRLETSRHVAGGILLLLVALVAFAIDSVLTKILAIVILACAVMLLWGSPRVVLNTAGGDLRASTGWPWTRPEAERFVGALRSRLFKDEKD